MTKIIAVINPKGGSGKTTMSTNLAYAIQSSGYNLLFVDADPQGTARKWHAKSNGEFLTMTGNDTKTIAKDIQGILRLNDSFDYIVIDGPPQIAELSAACIAAADYVLIPVQPSEYDVWETEDTIRLIQARRAAVKPDLKCSYVVSRAIKNTKIGEQIKQMLIDSGEDLLESYNCQRVAYTKGLGQGLTVFQGDDAKAIEEMAAIKDEILMKVIA